MLLTKGIDRLSLYPLAFGLLVLSRIRGEPSDGGFLPFLMAFLLRAKGETGRGFAIVIASASIGGFIGSVVGPCAPRHHARAGPCLRRWPCPCPIWAWISGHLQEPFFNGIHDPDPEVVAEIRERFVATDFFASCEPLDAPGDRAQPMTSLASVAAIGVERVLRLDGVCLLRGIPRPKSGDGIVRAASASSRVAAAVGRPLSGFHCGQRSERKTECEASAAAFAVSGVQAPSLSAGVFEGDG